MLHGAHHGFHGQYILVDSFNYILVVRICSVCLVHMHLNDLWTNKRQVYITVSRHGRTVGHVQHAKCEKNGKTFQKVSKVSITSPNASIWSFSEMAILCFASQPSHADQSWLGLHGVVGAFWLSVFVSFHISLLARSSSLSVFLPFNAVTMRLV